MAIYFDVFKDGERRYQLRTKNVAFVLEFDTEEEENVFELLLCSVKKEDFCWDDFVYSLPERLRHFGVELRQDFEGEGVFFQDVKREELRSKTTTLCVLGASCVTEEIVREAQAIPFKEVIPICLSSETDMDRVSDILSCVDFAVVEAHRWSPYHMKRLNELCVMRDLPWLYVSGVRGDEISLGPIFWGRRLGCYNCLKVREYSHVSDLASQLSYERYLEAGKNAAQADLVFFEALRVKMIAHFVLLEVLKFIESFALPSVWRTVVDINLSTLEVKKSHLLKLPYCPTCNPRVDYSPAPWLEEITLGKESREGCR
jgi:bacteriocin biosynthesis cyclodehydratase domain